MANVDFQEFLNSEIIEKNEKSNNKNLTLLIQILEKRTNEPKKEFIKEFEENLKIAKSKSFVFNEEKEKQKSSNENLTEPEVLEDDGDILISDMIKEDNNKEHSDIEGENIIEDTHSDSGVTSEELDEKYPDDNLSLNEKKYAYMYEVAIKEYYSLKISLERQNIKDGDICYDDRNFLKLMRLKEVAVKSEAWFKNSSGGKYVGEVIGSIADIENENERICADYQRQNNKEHEAANEKAQSLKEQIQECMDEIEAITNKITESNLEDNSSYIESLEAKNEQYVKLNKQFEMISPNPIELARQEEKSRQQDGSMSYHSDVVKQRKSDGVDINVVRKQVLHDKREEALDLNGTSKVVDSMNESRETTKEKYEQMIQDAISERRYDEAAKLNESYANIMTSDANKSDDREVMKNAQDFSDKIDSEKSKLENDRLEYNDIHFPDKADVGDNDFKKNLSENAVKSPEQIALEDASSTEKIIQIEEISTVGRTTSSEKYEVERKMEG